ncbi:MAG: class I SAM-dependent methyltransferase [Flavobacteriaceae bacterium]|nr:class I SAM-dependent methyltransferase [Flavobacteriaceae bacterium]
MKKTPIEIFSEWVDNGKDDGMEINHYDAVSAMLKQVLNNETNYSFIDAGCGNGWVVRKVSKDSNCSRAIGIDGSINMIEKAKSLDTINDYYCDELSIWKPAKKVNIVHSMEVLYYFKNPIVVLKNIFNNWLKENGKFIMGIDFYFENQPSHDWPEKTNISIMSLLSIKEWKDLFIKTGFKNIQTLRSGEKEDWKGTLIIMATKS